MVLDTEDGIDHTIMTIGKEEDMKEHIKTSLLLAIVCIISAGSLGYFYKLTTPIIEQRRIADQLSLQKEVLPQATDFKETKLEDKIIYLGISNGKIVGGVIKIDVKGYGGTIELMVGMDSTGKVTGVRVLSHSETPGLGEKAAKREYLSKFTGKSNSDINSVSLITGATISSRGIREGIKEGLKIISKAMESQSL